MPSRPQRQSTPELRLSWAGGTAVGAAVAIPWCVLEVLLRPAPALSSWLTAVCLGGCAGGLLGLAFSRVRTRLWLAFSLCAPAPLLGGSHLHWAVRRAWELAIAASPERTFAQIEAMVWVVVTLFSVGAASSAYIGLGGRTSSVLWRALGSASALVGGFVVGVQTFAVEGIDSATAIVLVALAAPFFLVIAGIWHRVIAAGLVVASGLGLHLLPVRYVELQAVMAGCALGASLLLARLATRRWTLLRAERRGATLLAGALVLSFGAVAHLLIASYPSAWRTSAGRGTLSVLVRTGHFLTDVDRDEHGGVFAQSDCRAFSPDVNPAAHEKPGNGIDDNCVAGDAVGDAEQWVRRAEQVNEPPPPFRGDVVLYTVDALRFDDAFGPSAPEFRAVAAEGIVFSRAYSTSTFTSQSLLALLVAMLPTSMDMVWENRLNGYPAEPPGGLAVMLRSQGFDTGFAGGQQKADRSIGRRGAMYFQPSVFGHGFRVAHLVHRKASAPEVFRAARRAWDALDDGKPRLLWVHDSSLHEAPANRTDYLSAVAASSQAFGSLRAHIGPEAIWVLSSDHGEEFHEHGGLKHARTLYDEVVRVPLVVAIPGREHRVVERTSTTRSLMPSLVTMLAPNLAPPGRGPYLCLGPSECRDMPAPMALELQDVHLHGLVLGRRKILRDLDRGLLLAFDLDADPTEQRPLWPVPHDLEAALVGWEEHAFGAQTRAFFWPYAAESPQ